MTKKDMTAILKEKNQNRNIHWAIAENTAEQIVVTNDYAKDIRYEINLHQGEGQDISIRNAHMDEKVGYLMQGTEFYADFLYEETGISQALAKVVKHFFYYY